MEKIKIVIVEDEFVIAEDISTRLREEGYETGPVFDRAENALPYIVSTLPDMVLVDIQLLGPMNGIELIHQVQQHVKIPVIYITANSDETTYEKAKITRPHAFLIKPFTPVNLLAAIDLALYNFSCGQSPGVIQRSTEEVSEEQLLVNQHLFIKSNGKYKKMLVNDLLFVEASGSYVHLQTVNERYTLSQNLTSFFRKTPLANLQRIHRSYIINFDKIDSFEESHVFIQNHKLPLGDHYRVEFMSRIHCL